MPSYPYTLYLSEHPKIIAEHVSPSICLVHFSNTQCNVSAQLLEMPTSFHRNSSGGAIDIKSDWLADGVVVIFQKLAVDDRPRLSAQAVQAVVNRLRETCSTCPDFREDLFAKPKKPKEGRRPTEPHK